MMLPKEKTTPKVNLEDFTTLIYGEPKIGKTTFAGQFDNPVFLATEPGFKALEIYPIVVTSWIGEQRRENGLVYSGFLQACESLAQEDDNRFRTIVIDTVDNLGDYCSAFVRKKHGIEHESDLEWGKGWEFFRQEFSRAINKLAGLDYGLVFISHTQAKEVKTPTGKKTKYKPTFNNTIRKVLLPLVDNFLFARKLENSDGQHRVLETTPSEVWEAGTRVGMTERVPLDYEVFAEKFKEAAKTKFGKEAS